MDMRQITPTYFVAPQIEAGDIPELAASGFSRIICNRPDSEVPPSQQHEAIEAAASEAGLEFVYHPLTHTTMTAANIARQRELAATAKGSVLAYCASGTRCSVAWALTQAEDLSSDEILAATASAGYDLAGLRPALDAVRDGS